VIKTQQQLEKATKYWQRLLRLQDWELDVQFAVPPEIEEGAYGICRISDMYRRAKIRLLKPGCTDKQGLVKNDITATLLHELIHIHIHTITGINKKAYEEFVIEALAHAFAELKNGVRTFA
jgi:hypothetical protein